MIRALSVSVAVHLAAVGALVWRSDAAPLQPVRAQVTVVRLVEMPGGGLAEVPSKAKDEGVGGHPVTLTPPPKAPRRVEARAVAPAVDAVEALPAAATAQTEELVPLGGGVGQEGAGELARGSIRALVEAKVQEVAMLWSGSKQLRTETITFRVNADGDVADRGHYRDLEKILHLSEPFKPGTYTVTIRY